ncbi:hypothetical protein M3Y95_01018000 [Aphelenchoides besseyi]|nr:hypothetical protein M3Y95_01018000 [Aphelenchoides besseyi]
MTKMPINWMAKVRTEIESEKPLLSNTRCWKCGIHVRSKSSINSHAKAHNRTPEFDYTCSMCACYFKRAHARNVHELYVDMFPRQYDKLMCNENQISKHQLSEVFNLGFKFWEVQMSAKSIEEPGIMATSQEIQDLIDKDSPLLESLRPKKTRPSRGLHNGRIQKAQRPQFDAHSSRNTNFHFSSTTPNTRYLDQNVNENSPHGLFLDGRYRAQRAGAMIPEITSQQWNFINSSFPYVQYLSFLKANEHSRVKHRGERSVSSGYSYDNPFESRHQAVAGCGWFSNQTPRNDGEAIQTDKFGRPLPCELTAPRGRDVCPAELFFHRSCVHPSIYTTPPIPADKANELMEDLLELGDELVRIWNERGNNDEDDQPSAASAG